eukprot:NODE_26_length_35450_cov_0.398320.p23 type:complete len:137 gc:universal NODE_26_length_35450_cov_0.398320:32724-32314(-)
MCTINAMLEGLSANELDLYFEQAPAIMVKSFLPVPRVLYMYSLLSTMSLYWVLGDKLVKVTLCNSKSPFLYRIDFSITASRLLILKLACFSILKYNLLVVATAQMYMFKRGLNNAVDIWLAKSQTLRRSLHRCSRV